MSLALVTSHSSNNQELFETTRLNHNEYCKRHGYIYIPNEEPYNPYTDTNKVRKLLNTYSIVVTMGVDLWIQHPERALEDFAHEGITMCRELGGTLNADLIVYKDCQDTYRILDAIDSFQYKLRTGQQALNNLSKDPRYIIFEENSMQIAAPCMNPDTDYSSVRVEDYFALHFHTYGKRPSVADKLQRIKEWLND